MNLSFEPIKDENGKDIDLQELVSAASTEIMVERRREATSLIKSFLMKVEGLDKEIKGLKNQLKSKEESRDKTLVKIERLRQGDWAILSENNSGSKADSEKNS